MPMPMSANHITPILHTMNRVNVQGEPFTPRTPGETSILKQAQTLGLVELIAHGRQGERGWWITDDELSLQENLK